MLRVGVEGRTSVAFCGGLTGRRVAPADPIRRRSGRDWNDDMGRDGCPRALDLRGVVGRRDRRAVASAVRRGRGRAGGRLAGWVAGAGALLLRGGPDRVRALPGGGRGRDRLSGRSCGSRPSFLPRCSGVPGVWGCLALGYVSWGTRSLISASACVCSSVGVLSCGKVAL